MLLLGKESADRIRAHGAESYPHECCGALLGIDSETHREVHDTFAMVNRRDDSPRNRFSITAQDFRDAERAARELGLELVGWYHSHPDHPAQPSEYDREHAWPWYSYVIVSLTARLPGEITAWRLADDRSQFAPEEIQLQTRAATPRAAG